MYASKLCVYASVDFFLEADATCYNPTLLALFIHLNFADQIASPTPTCCALAS